ncbi:MAG: alanine racemase, partial [Bacteroidota bacterium]
LTEARFLESAGQRAKKTIPVHLKIETGMNRIGVPVDGLRPFLRSIRSLRRLEIKGVYSHFATSEERDKRFARIQLRRFHEALEILKREGVSPELLHMANSGAVLDVPESYFSMVRPGMMMYGYYPSHDTTESVTLKTAMMLRSRVSLVKWIERSESVGYGRKFTARKRTKIATVPVGYADGFSRLLSGKASVLIHGKKFPVAGSIAMDQIMINVGKADVGVGDEVVLMGSQGTQSITAWDIADILGTVPYEVCSSVAERVPRVYKKS